MATYKEIHGTVIETVTSDPSNPVNGQVWYNSTDQVLKGFTSNPAGGWSTSGNLNTARKSLEGTGASNSAAIAFGGTANPPIYALTEIYNGSAWTEVADLNVGRTSMGAAGTSTAAIGFGGYNGTARVATNETWNGSS